MYVCVRKALTQCLRIYLVVLWVLEHLLDK
jgi:hypothetical protein